MNEKEIRKDEREKVIAEIREELEKLYWCTEHRANCDHAFDFCGLTDLLIKLSKPTQ